MKYLFLFLFLFFAPFKSQAGWFDDKRDACYNWAGEREPCSRSSLRRETHLAGKYDLFYGDKTASLTEGFATGIVLTTVRSHDSFRFIWGGQGSYSSSDAYINENDYNTVTMSFDFILGLSFKPYRSTTLQPVIELDLLAGLKSVEFASPPNDVDEKNLKPSYGGKLSIGLDFKIGRLTAIRPAIEYQINRVPGIIDNEDFNLDSLGFSLGLVFL